MAGGQAMSEVITCGVVEAKEASQRARRAARPRRVPLWDDAGGREVHGPCGSTLGRADTSACGRLLRMCVAFGVACGVVEAEEASQRARRAVRPRRVPLWDDAGGREVHGPCGSTLGQADTSACGRLLRMGVACGVARRAVALQEARRAEGPRRASLWENA